MQYVGNKSKIVDGILEVMLLETYDPDKGLEGLPYIEPFVGSAAVISKIPAGFTRFGNDRNPYLIAMLCAVRDGWVPPENVSEEEYKAAQHSPHKFAPEFVGFVSFACSFGGKQWGGYAFNNSGTNYARQGSRSLVKQSPSLKGITFTAGNYEDLSIPDGALVYCDPPYAGTLGYGYSVDNFGDFKRWCEKLVARGVKVFISGYKRNRMTGWDIVWSQDVKTVMDKNKSGWRSERTEVLLQHNSQSGIIHPPEVQEVVVDCCPVCKSEDPAEFFPECEEKWNEWHGDNFPPDFDWCKWCKKLCGTIHGPQEGCMYNRDIILTDDDIPF